MNVFAYTICISSSFNLFRSTFSLSWMWISAKNVTNVDDEVFSALHLIDNAIFKQQRNFLSQTEITVFLQWPNLTFLRLDVNHILQYKCMDI